MRGPWKLGTRPRSLWVYAETFLARIADLILRCHIQRCRSFSEGVSPRIIVLERQPGKQSLRLKRSREITTEPIAEWVQTTKNSESTMVCSYCCYYFNITVKQIIAMKRAKYENVVGLVALILLKHATSFFHRAKYVDLQIWKDKTFGNLNEISYFKLVGFLVRWKKKDITSCMILCGELCGINDEPMFLKS